jgi:flagellar motility protein MotE (MotC chaperone)
MKELSSVTSERELNHRPTYIGDGAMKRKGPFAFGFFVVLVLLVVLSLKLLVATGNLVIQHKGLNSFFSTPEVLATDQQKNSPQPVEKDRTDRPPVEPESVKTAKCSNPASAEVLSYLEQKEMELKRKERSLQEQEQHLLEMQKEVEQKLQELIVIQKDIQNFRNEKTENKNASVRSLAQIYGSMKPKEAAKLLENMDEKLVVSLVSTLKANEAAEIFAAMDSKKAAKISEALTQR